MVPPPIRPVFYIGTAIEIQVAVLEEVILAPGYRPAQLGHRPVEVHRARASRHTRHIGELTQRPGHEVVAGTCRARLGADVLADSGARVTRALPGLPGALEPADTGLRGLGVGEGLAGRAGRVRHRVGQRGARLEVPDLLFHQHATLERRPRHRVLLGEKLACPAGPVLSRVRRVMFQKPGNGPHPGRPELSLTCPDAAPILLATRRQQTLR